MGRLATSCVNIITVNKEPLNIGPDQMAAEVKGQ